MKNLKFLLLPLFVLFNLWTTPAAAQFTPVQEQQLQSKDYSQNGGFENGISKWFTYNDGAVSAPVDCIGGSPAITLTAPTANALTGKASGLLTKPASNVFGQGYAMPFSLDKQSSAKIVNISGAYEIASGNYSGGTQTTDSDLVVYIYDAAASGTPTIIQPAGFKLDGGVTNNQYTYNVTFQAPQYTTSTRDFRLCLHYATTSASASAVRLDSVKTTVGYAKVQGAPATDTISYTPSTTNFGGFGTIVSGGFEYVRFADSIYIKGRFSLGTVAATIAQVPLPDGLVIDTAKVPTQKIIGSFQRQGTNEDYAVLMAGGNNFVTIGATTQRLSSALGNIFTTGDLVSFFAGPIPITGWGSTVTLSENADTRIVSMSYFKNGGTVNATSNYASYTSGSDSHGAFNATTGNYTVPVPGDYDFTGCANTNLSTVQLYMLVDGSGTHRSAVSTNGTICFSGKLRSLRAGQVVALYNGTASALTVTSNSTDTYFSLSRVSGPSQIAASESVNASYSSAAGNSIGTTDTLQVFATKSFDSHGGSYNSTTGVFTAPMSGKYRVSVNILTAALVLGTTQSIYVSVYKNGSGLRRIDTRFGSGANVSIGLSGSTTVSLLANETLSIYATSNVATSQFANSDFNFISIERIGN